MKLFTGASVMINKSIALGLAAAAVVVVTGCGGNTVGDDDSGSKAFTGAFVDSGIAGVTYTCGDGKTGVTGANGLFTCDSAPVRFSLGNIRLGSIDAITSDYLVFPQDIAGVPRTEVNDDVASMAILLQSCDSDGDPSNGITVASATVTVINNNLGGEADISAFLPTQMEYFTEKVVADSVATYPKMSRFTEEAALAHLELTVENPPAAPKQPGEATGSEGGN
jgi:hypothetical protein